MKPIALILFLLAVLHVAAQHEGPAMISRAGAVAVSDARFPALKDSLDRAPEA